MATRRIGWRRRGVRCCSACLGRFREADESDVLPPVPVRVAVAPVVTVEEPAWHRHVGFKDAGAIVNLGPVQHVPEIVFIKQLGAESP